VPPVANSFRCGGQRGGQAGGYL